MTFVLKLIKNRLFWLSLLLGVTSLYLVTCIVELVIYSLQHGTQMSSYPTNGTFQLYNPLRRIELGQIAGKDFPFFHGVGVPFLHYPVFHLLGSNVFAAETAKYIVSPALFIFSSAVFFYAFFRNYKKTIIALGLITALGSLWMLDSFYPGNSLIGVRTTFPMLTAAALVWNSKAVLKVSKFMTIQVSTLIALLLLGFGFVCGTEQGIASIIAFFSIRTYYYLKQTTYTKKQALPRLAFELVLGGIVTLLVLAVATQGHVFSALKYALVDIPADQGWYFGAPPNLYLSWENIFYALSRPGFPTLYIIIISGIVALIIARKKKLLTTPQMQGFIFLIVYGLVVFAASSTGYFWPSAHLVPLQRGLALIFIAIVVMYLYKDAQIRLKLRSVKQLLFIGVVVLISLCIAYQSFNKVSDTVELHPVQVLKTAKEARHEGDRFSLVYGWGYNVDKLLPYITPGARVWSTYTSVYDSILGQLNPSKGGEDYIIHALGDERREAYNSQFVNDKPEFAITMRPSFFNYEEWLWGSHWDFYRQLFTHYSIVETTNSHILWKLNTDSTYKKDTPATAVPKIDNKWALPANATNIPQLYEVTVEYKASANLVAPQLNRIPRYLVDVKNSGVMLCSLSLPPSKNSWTFPVAIAPGKSNVHIEAAARGILPTASLDIKQLSYKPVQIPEKNNFVFGDNTKNTVSVKERKQVCTN